MAKRLMSVMVRGRESAWAFNFYGDIDDLVSWHADGLDVVVIENVIPAWAVDLGLTRPWIWLQDLWHLRVFDRLPRGPWRS